MADTYLTLGELKDRMDIPDAADNDSLESALMSAVGAINGFCGRRFSKRTETRHFTAASPDILRPGDLVSITTLKTGEDFEDTWTLNEDYILEPLNAALDGEPFQVIRRKDTLLFPETLRGVEIAGQFGWPAVPAAVKKATAIQAAKLFKRSTEAPFGANDLSFAPNIGGMQSPNAPSRYLDREAQLLLQPYRKVVI